MERSEKEIERTRSARRSGHGTCSAGMCPPERGLTAENGSKDLEGDRNPRKERPSNTRIRWSKVQSSKRSNTLEVALAGSKVRNVKAATPETREAGESAREHQEGNGGGDTVRLRRENFFEGSVATRECRRCP